MPYYSMLCGRHSLKRPYCQFRGGCQPTYYPFGYPLLYEPVQIQEQRNPDSDPFPHADTLQSPIELSPVVIERNLPSDEVLENESRPPTLKEEVKEDEEVRSRVRRTMLKNDQTN
jgi:hypothetical protein